MNNDRAGKGLTMTASEFTDHTARKYLRRKALAPFYGSAALIKVPISGLAKGSFNIAALTLEQSDRQGRENLEARLSIFWETVVLRMEEIGESMDGNGGLSVETRRHARNADSSLSASRFPSCSRFSSGPFSGRHGS